MPSPSSAIHRPFTVRPPAALVAIALAVLAAVVAPAVTLGDAALVSTSPAAGAAVEGSPAAIVATFDEPLAANSTIELYREGGGAVASGGADPADPTSLRIAAPALEPGTYEARIAAFSSDGHLVRRTFTFTVVAVATRSPADETASPAVIRSAVPATPGGSAASDPAGAEPPAAEALLPVAATVVILTLVGAWLVRQRAGRPG